MYLQEFGLEVLVNGHPLPEYSLPINESDLKNTSVSCVTDSLTQMKKYSDFTTYVPVITGERYTVKFEAKQANSSNIIISRVYVDGQSDQVQNLLQQPCSRMRSFFCNHERTKVYFFKFPHFDKKDAPNNGGFKVPFPVNKKSPIKQQQNIYGKPGSITVCFFKGIIVNQNALQDEKEFEIKQVKIPKTVDNKNSEICYTTGFDAKCAKILPATVTKIVDLNPIAVLHVHYRSADWLANKKLSLPILNFSQENKNNGITQEIENRDNVDNFEQKLERSTANLKRNMDVLDEKECNEDTKKLCVE